ncbi:MAG: glycosyltransferase family 2 protein [Verrucomicrobiales bacterium]|nr:glycosyltransferase family 2 protein [Verrucomicrobiales bacterium]
MACSVLIPALQPGSGLRGVVSALAADERVRRIWLIDDGSGSEFAERFEEAAAVSEKVRLLRHPMNLGKGVALRTGMQAFLAEREEAEVLVTADADGQHLPEDILRVAERAVECPDALVLGTRAFGEGTPLRSQFGNSLTKWVFRLLTGISLTDTQTGLRGIPLGLMGALLRVDARRYQFELVMLLQAFARRFRFETVPIQTVYLENNAASHFNPVVDSIRIYWVFVRFAWTYLLPLLVDFAIFWLLQGWGAPLGVSLLAGKAAMPGVRTLQAQLGEPDGLVRAGPRGGKLMLRVLMQTLISGALVVLGMKTLGWSAVSAKVLAEAVIGLLKMLRFRSSGTR